MNDAYRYGVAIFAVTFIGIGLAIIVLAPLLNAALQYSMGGKINPAQLALSVGGSFVPGLLGGIDPSIAQAYRIGSTALGAGSAINQASKGNYDPAINAAAGYGLKQLTGALG